MLVTLHVWRVPAYGVPAALARVAATAQPLRRERGVRFAKLLGTGDGRTFTIRAATPRRWALLAVRDDGLDPDDSPTVRRWDAAADERWVAVLDPLAVRGRWSGREPFGQPAPRRADGPVAALTRARIAPRKLATFWRAVPPVAVDLQRAAGLRFALGVGEAPVGLQGTFSVWRDAEALREFAHRRAAHVEAIRRTAAEGWYAEELFARFAVRRAEGCVDGVDPLAPR